MEIKRNEATINRPDGNRVIDGTYVFVDIPSYVAQIKQEKAWETNERNGITVFKSDRVAIVVAALHAEASIEKNIVNGFITIQMLEGKARITTPDGDVDAEKGQIINFHPGIEHSIYAVTDMIMLLTNHNLDSDSDNEDFEDEE